MGPATISKDNCNNQEFSPTLDNPFDFKGECNWETK